MPSISPLQLTHLAKILQLEKPVSGTTGIAVGDFLEISVLRNLENGSLLIRLGAESVRAESAIPLRVGETVTVRVEETRPLVVLSVAEGAMQESGRVTDFLRFQRSNPAGLLTLISDLPGAFEAGNLAPFLPHIDKELVQVLLKLLDSLQLSAKTAPDRLCFKEYVENLGLLWESGLKKALKEGGFETGKAGLKGVLMQLSEELQALAGRKDIFDADILRRLDALQKTTAGSLKSLESEQVMNVLHQENEGRYFFQVPFLLSSGPRMADICISFEDRGAKQEGKEGFRVLFLLSLDALGDVSVEAGIKARRLDCRIRCTDRDACAFIASSLKRLEDGLTGHGFQVESMQCHFEDDLSEVREQFQQARLFEGADAVNIFI